MLSTEGERLLPSCAAYYRVTMEGQPFAAGDHDAFFVNIDGVFTEDTAGDDRLTPHLSTLHLRTNGLITPAGRAVPPVS